MKEIPLLNHGKVALVDDDDFERINRNNWFSHKVVNTFYAERYITVAPNKRSLITMHSEIINIPKGMQCDHIDGNGLNNQKENLRSVTPRQNQQNQHAPKSSKFPGISLQKRDGKYRAKIKINGVGIHIGTFDSEDEAARQYLTACKIVEVFQPNGNHTSAPAPSTVVEDITFEGAAIVQAARAEAAKAAREQDIEKLESLCSTRKSRYEDPSEPEDRREFLRGMNEGAQMARSLIQSLRQPEPQQEGRLR